MKKTLSMTFIVLLISAFYFSAFAASTETCTGGVDGYSCSGWGKITYSTLDAATSSGSYNQTKNVYCKYYQIKINSTTQVMREGGVSSNSEASITWNSYTGYKSNFATIKHTVTGSSTWTATRTIDY